MEFYTVRDLRTSSKNIWESLSNNDVVITNNGKPSALMMNIPEGNFEEALNAVRQARAMIAINNMHRDAAEAGLDKMNLDEINAEIAAARAEINL